jgi:carboxypeptidase C (cathepsin A)
MRLPHLAFAALIALMPSAAQAGNDSQGAETAVSVTLEVPEPSVTQHGLDVEGGTIAYEARVEMIEITDAARELAAHIFTTAYIAEGDDRPVTFLMNGGPGAASAYLHVGGLGPWTIDTDELGRPVDSGALIENPDTWLAFTDLVFLDPVGTGFSRPVDPGDTSFYDHDADLDSIARAIDLWLDGNERRASLVYLAGESYGGYRAAALPKRLMHGRGIQLAGTILISPVIDFSTVRHHAARPLSWALLLPSYAAAAAGHDRAEEVLADELRAFALEDYLLALVHPARMEALVPRLAEITGLDADLLHERRGRIRPNEFRNRLLADDRLVVSAYDGLIAVPRPARSRSTHVDPVLDGMTPAYVTGILDHLRTRLDWRHGRDYRLLNREVHRAWTYGFGGRQGYISALGDLQEVMALDPGFRLLSVHGETDLVTPWLATEWLMEQIDDALGGADDRLIFAAYPGGHMFYMRPDARAAFAADAARFFAGR